MTMKQISVYATNVSTGLADISEILGENNIDIRALSVADSTDFNIFRLIVDNPEKALTALRSHGFVVSVTEVFAIRLDDKPGALASVLKILSSHNIATQYIYAFIPRGAANAYVVLKVADNESAIKVLKEAEFHFISSDM